MKRLLKKLFPLKRIKINVYAIELEEGIDIVSAIRKAIASVPNKKAIVQFDYKGVMVSVRADSDPGSIWHDWDLAYHGLGSKNVGPRTVYGSGIRDGSFKQVAENVYTAEGSGGANILDVILEAISLVPDKNATLKIVFNDVPMSIRSDSNPWLLLREWERVYWAHGSKEVGPYPNEIPTAEEEIVDAKREARKRSAAASLNKLPCYSEEAGEKAS